MRAMVIVKADAQSEQGALPTPELLEAMMAFNEELLAAGVMVSGDGLTPSSQGARVHFDGASRTVMDGPFAETKELIAGYWIWEVPSMAAAIDWVKRCPNPQFGPSDIEIRPIGALEDFGDIVPPETEARWREMKEQAAARHGG